MLSYLNYGLRDYYSNPVRTIRRGVWEFQAVIKGIISPVIINNNTRNYREKTFWLFPPDSSHGWNGKKDIASEIVVFHFSNITTELADLCCKKDYLSIKLTDAEIEQIMDLYRLIEDEYSNPGGLYPLKSRIAADQLSLLFCYGNQNLIKKPGSSYGHNIVEKALALFSSEMHLSLSIVDISKRIGVSVSHIRRLFHKIKGANPRTVFEEVRMTRAMELACFTEYSFLEIANTCGFTDQSAFTKAFCRYWKAAPTTARKTGEFKTTLFRKREKS